MALLEFNDKGIYCPQAKVYIDPWKPVDYALITHGHADHSRFGHKHYLCTESAAPVIKYRLGADISLETVRYGESKTINQVTFSFYPAGHIVGSAQIRVSYKGETWVVSGDYKLENDTISEPFEPIPCHTFITECTFGLPLYTWQPQDTLYSSINAWWQSNQAQGKVSVITAYALGKAQRIIRHLDNSQGPVFTHGAVENVNEILRGQGVDLPATIRVTTEHRKEDFRGGIVIATPGALGSPWMKKFQPYSTAMASGWMALRGTRRRRSADRGFALSDHADWDGLNQAIRQTGAERVYVTHGYTSIFRQWLEDQGYDAHEVKTEFAGETDENEKPEVTT
jgi:putative mRNA 3-end processing factor